MFRAQTLSDFHHGHKTTQGNPHSSNESLDVCVWLGVAMFETTPFISSVAVWLTCGCGFPSVWQESERSLPSCTLTFPEAGVAVMVGGVRTFSVWLVIRLPTVLVATQDTWPSIELSTLQQQGRIVMKNNNKD